jgi:hypothetical protein
MSDDPFKRAQAAELNRIVMSDLERGLVGRIEALMAELEAVKKARDDMQQHAARNWGEVEALTAERDDWKKRHFQMRDERDAKAIAAKNYADFNHEWRKRAEAAEAERDALKEELGAVKEAYDDIEQYARRHCAEVEALTAENARLRGALKPFADEAGHWDFYTADEPLVEGFATYEGNITVGDLRDARAALTGKETK